MRIIRRKRIREASEQHSEWKASLAAWYKEIVAWQLAEAMKKRKISKKKMAMLLKTSRTQFDRLLSAKKRHHVVESAAGCGDCGAPRRDRAGVRRAGRSR